jgi:hypothetical protein
MSGPAAATGTVPPEVYEATRATDGTGAVIKGEHLTRAQAEARRQAGLDIVVCGADETDNYLLAADIEASAGPWTHHRPHPVSAGPDALPHFQQRRFPPRGHSFYETTTRKAV